MPLRPRRPCPHPGCERFPVAELIAESCVVQEGACAIEELYAAYAQWSKASGERAPLSKKAFGGRLLSHGFAADRGARGVAIRRGIGLRDQQRLGMTAAAIADASAVGSKLPV